ncbi:L,D-transpeptidase [Oricola thermophila]|uniref:L,D-transpeptidase n=1 Tax=Oricola thermophila TaxID=2742145 RepID=A0A6N1VJY0_9HYPH|nr:L,D-transpeptidase [Oricola thermophila]QKV19227.1 L,D-transpeptidase [Oricola thermophila]
MKPIRLLAAIAACFIFALPATAQERYRSKPPVVLSPDLAAPWVMQLNSQRSITGNSVRSNAKKVIVRPAKRAAPPVRTAPRVQTVSAPRPANPTQGFELDPVFLPQTVAYHGPEAPGTIVIDTVDRFLYLVGENGTARRYGVGVGKPGFEWAGTHKITRKAEWPSWRPPAEMIKREKAKGRILPVFMAGGPANPLGARALYLGSTLYRIHGTNAPWTIGQAVSSGCIRMRNEDVIDLYGRVGVGTKVIVR